MNHPTRIFAGYTVMLCCHTGYVACRFAELHARVDRKSGQLVDKRPHRCVSGALEPPIRTGECVDPHRAPKRLLGSSVCVRPTNNSPPGIAKGRLA